MGAGEGRSAETVSLPVIWSDEAKAEFISPSSGMPRLACILPSDLYRLSEIPSGSLKNLRFAFLLSIGTDGVRE